ncbi:MAG: hypothetical protein JRI95_13845 [Deltaproteobacteria bacterium]|nr:hypothetical protein [Deltaproteobacteria bacterium]
MKPKREMIPALTLSQNFRLAMTDAGLTFKDLSRKARVSLDTAYRLAERRSPKFVTDEALRVGKALGFTKKQVEEKIRQDRLDAGHAYSKKEELYRLVRQMIDLFD